MSMIHQKLYPIDNVTQINISDFIKELVGYLKTSLGAPSSITFQTYISPIELEVSYAVPIALIITEFITSAVKYAFPDGQKGLIKITLTSVVNRFYDRKHCFNILILLIACPLIKHLYNLHRINCFQ
jgi:two-component sensor histidine kinase